jgi:hypothetical protein
MIDEIKENDNKHLDEFKENMNKKLNKLRKTMKDMKGNSIKI